MPRTARAALVRRFGPPEAITLEEIEVADPGPGEVLVAVRTGGVNPVDARRRSGSFGGAVPLLLGTELAGTVVASQDPRWVPGVDVIGWGVAGADAELVRISGDRLVAKPAELDWHLAGGLGGVGQTALTVLEELELAAGDVVVVHGASGGVGTVLVQLAVARGLKVIGTAGPANHDYLRELGAEPVAYGEGVAARIAAAAGGPLDASIDLAGTAEAGDVALAVARSGGRAVTLVPETMASHRIPLVQTRPTAAKLGVLIEAVLAGSLVLPVEAVPFEKIVEVHRRLDAGHARGKVVLDLAANPYLSQEA